ncbi:hypothetical protein SAMN05444141_108271 [Pseudovibrio denitrificans]|uniref:Uncharacterized protein n=1 Tax=Pseudovibrio denitrificans TaxID=258256 RepID=A0A1I7DEZ0_9HYPH|nr:hypothetical protein SAMN05444141_108271 [Pseudovibrio denitrificans]
MESLLRNAVKVTLGYLLVSNGSYVKTPNAHSVQLSEGGNLPLPRSKYLNQNLFLGFRMIICCGKSTYFLPKRDLCQFA